MELIAENHQLELLDLGCWTSKRDRLCRRDRRRFRGIRRESERREATTSSGFPTPASDSGISAGPVWRSGDQVAIMFPPQEPPTEFIQ